MPRAFSRANPSAAWPRVGWTWIDSISLASSTLRRNGSWPYLSATSRPSALAGWSNQSLESLVSPIVLAAKARPANDLLSSLGPVLQDATLQVIRQQVDPAQAAETAVESLAVPPTK